jgi:hypothetical protein
MPSSPALRPRPSHVTVKFGDGVHSFPLSQGITLAELAGCIDVLGAKHEGVPISIDVAFSNTQAQSAFRLATSHRLSH